MATRILTLNFKATGIITLNFKATGILKLNLKATGILTLNFKATGIIKTSLMIVFTTNQCTYIIGTLILMLMNSEISNYLTNLSPW